MKEIKNLLMCIALVTAFCITACEMPDIGKVETFYKEGDIKIETTLKAGEDKEDSESIHAVMQQNLQQESEKLGVGPYDIGVIPEQNSCPPNTTTEYIKIYMDDEDTFNNNKTSGWTGAINNSKNTTFVFCRVDGSKFKPLIRNDDPNYNYAVLSLGANCPPGSERYSRYFDNEDSDNANYFNGNINPNISSNNTLLSFCFFKNADSTTNTMSSFPDLGFNYGVFSHQNFALRKNSGYIYTDDEDNRNANKWNIPSGLEEDVQQIMDGGANTTLRLVKVIGDEDIKVIKGPYLQNVQQNAITTCWETTFPCKGRVVYTNPQGIAMEKVETIEKTLHEIVINNLAADTKYDYQIFSNQLQGDKASFKTAPYQGNPIRFAVWGDSQTNYTTFEKIVNQMQKWKPDIAICVGDTVQDGSVYERWGTEYFGPIKNLAMTVPTYIAIGNHENQSPYFNAFVSQPGNEHWFSFPYGNSHFVIMDTNRSYISGSEQYTWLIQDTNSYSFNQAAFKFIFFHHPPYTELWDSSSYNGEALVRQYIVPVIEQKGFNILFNGHAHAYNRGRWPEQGPYYIVTGGGGGNLDTVHVGDWPQIQYSESIHHFMIIDVEDTIVTGRAVSIDGVVFDTFQIERL